MNDNEPGPLAMLIGAIVVIAIVIVIVVVLASAGHAWTPTCSTKYC